MKDKLLHLVPPTTKKEEQSIVGRFWLWRQNKPHWDRLLWPIYQVTQKTSSFVWCLEQEKALQQDQAAVQAILPIEPYDPADLMILELSVANGDAVGSLRQAPIGLSQKRPFVILKKTSNIIYRQLFFL